jgi:TonB-dependent SusC/RagA subfamily outer membrane receptor
MDEMMKAPVGTFAEALAGRVAGVKVNAADGQPGGGINIVIRGAGSLTQSTSPLYVIDGFPVEDPDPGSINPEEIESMTILKDASSTAIYGSRAANGVILIQTKRGKVGKPTVNFSSSYGIQSVPTPMELMSPYEFIK